MFYSTTLNLCEKRVEYGHDVSLFIGRMTKRIKSKCIVTDAGDEIKVETLLVYLSSVPHLVQYIELHYAQSH